MQSMPNIFNHFCNRHPAFIYGLTIFLGIILAIKPAWYLCLPCICLGAIFVFSGAQSLLRLACALTLGLAAYVNMSLNLIQPKLKESGEEGFASLSIANINEASTHFGKQWVIQGKLLTFKDLHHNVIARNIPIKLFFPKRNFKRPPANIDYVLEGCLKSNRYGKYTFKPKKCGPWEPIKGSWSIAEMRFKAKQTFSTYIFEIIPDRLSAHFLVGLLTGNFDDPMMAFEFSRFGLQHIMAISGFHFSIIALLFSVFFRLVFDPKKSTICLIIILTSYFCFLGASASILRAWISAIASLCGILLKKKENALNSLGLGLIAICLFDPLAILGLGFIFSFAITWAILTLYSPIDAVMLKLFKKRELSVVVEMNTLNQYGYIVLSWLRQMISLSLAVNMVALPLVLFFFHKFPLLSFIYNLFFPFLVSISMFLMMVGIIFPFQVLNHLNSTYTKFILDLVYNMPKSFDSTLIIESFPAPLLVGYLCMLFILSIYLSHYVKQKQAFIFI